MGGVIAGVRRGSCPHPCLVSVPTLPPHSKIPGAAHAVDRWKSAKLSRFESMHLLVRERSALADPYCHLAWMSVCVFVRNFEVKYLGNERS